jgi:hypothetical protein
MTASNMIRIATTDTTGAVEIACSEVKIAVGLPVTAAFQEIEGGCLILELRLGNESGLTPSPSRLAAVVDESLSNVEVLSAWKVRSASASPPPRHSDTILTPLHDSIPSVAHRAVHDGLPTAQWQSNEGSWQLAVPNVCAIQPTMVGLSRRRGYSQRFSSLEAAAIQRGLAS